MTRQLETCERISNAMTLRERIEHVQRSPATIEVDDAQRGRRLRRWREHAPLEQEAAFLQRLALEDLQADDVETALGITTRSLAASPPADWEETLERWLACDPPVGPEESPPGASGTAFWGVICRFVRGALDEAEARAEGAGCALLVRGSLRRLLFDSLPFDRMDSLVSRALVLELNAMRLSGSLRGDSAESRLRDFRSQFQERERVRGFLREYPVLARQLMRLLRAWIEYSVEILTRTQLDRAALIHTIFAGADPGRLIQIQAGRGDTHRGGRSVAVLEFESGGRVVYKPRSLAVEAHFQEVLRWANGRTEEARLRTVGILEGEGYGWMEFVETEDCADPGEVRQFYTRIGRLMAILAALDATDMHEENLVASGADPVLIDLECLFQPRLYAHVDFDGKRVRDGDEFVSLFRSGLLPERVWESDEHPGVDVSGLGGRDGQEFPDWGLTIENLESDECRVVSRGRTVSAGSHNRPRLGGEEARPDEHCADIVRGFRETYLAIARCHDEFFGPTGPVDLFAHDEVRVLSRDTRYYAILLQDSYHPDFLRDATEREALLESLWSEMEFRPFFQRLIRFERRDLEEGDVPIFTGRPDSRDLIASQGERIEEVLEQTSLDMVRSQATQITEDSLHRHVYAIEASLCALRAGNSAPWSGSDRGGGPRLSASHPSTSNRPVASAVARAVERAVFDLGDRLRQLAYLGDDMACWAGLVRRSDFWTVDILGAPLARATGGVALFLAELAAWGGRPEDRRLAKMALHSVRLGAWKIHSVAPGVLPLRVSDGWKGILYTLDRAGALLEDPQSVDHARRIEAVIAASLAPRIRPEQAAEPRVFAEDHSLGWGAARDLHDGVDRVIAGSLDREALDRHAGLLQASGTEGGWRCHTPDGIETPGLIDGLAGIGYAMLRYLSPERIPALPWLDQLTEEGGRRS